MEDLVDYAKYPSDKPIMKSLVLDYPEVKHIVYQLIHGLVGKDIHYPVKSQHRLPGLGVGVWDAKHQLICYFKGADLADLVAETMNSESKLKRK